MGEPFGQEKPFFYKIKKVSSAEPTDQACIQKISETHLLINRQVNLGNIV